MAVTKKKKEKKTRKRPSGEKSSTVSAKEKKKKERKKGGTKRKPSQLAKKQAEKVVQEILNSVESKPEYVKHLIFCRCYLSQFRTLDEPPNHGFVVFSELDKKGDVKPSYAQCNNCGIVHRVTEVGQSVTIKKEEMKSLVTIDDVKPSLPEWLAGILEQYDVDLPTWQEASFIFRNQLWGRAIILAKEREGDLVIGKILVILGKELHKIDTFERDEGGISRDD